MNKSLASSDGTLGPMLWLALPVLAEQLLNVMVGFVDTWLAGHYLRGDAYLAAIGLMSYVLWLLPSLFAAVAIGATALTARFVGAQDWPAAVKVANQALVIGILFAVMATAATAWGGPWFVAAMQLEGEAARLASRYLAWMTLAVPAIMIEQVGIACLRGAGDTISGLAAMTVVNLVNVVLSYSLVTGAGPLPDWGWDALAFGTAVGHLIGATIILTLLLRGRAGLHLAVSYLQPDSLMLGRLLRIGWPGGIDVLAVLTCHLWFLAIINSLGTIQAAAHGLGIRIESLAYLPGGAFQVAAATLTGQFLGAGQPRRAMGSVFLASVVGGGLMTAAGVVFYFHGDLLTIFFLGENAPQTAALAADLLQVVAFSMPSLALTLVLTGALRGAGDTRWPLVFTFIGFLLVRIPGTYLLAWSVIPLPLSALSISGFGWGVIGAWYAMVADIVVRSMLVLARFLQGGWKSIQV